LPANKPEAAVNTSSRTVHVRKPRRSLLAPLFACAATLLALPVHAAVTLPDTPMQTNNGVPPNILFVLDDSGSMAFTAMPADRTDFARSGTPALGNTLAERAYPHNTIYYNPNIEYRPWQRADGTFFTGGQDYTNVFTHTWLLQGDNNTTDWSGTNLGAGMPENLSTVDQLYFVPIGANTALNNSNYYRFTILSASHPTSPGRIQRCSWTGFAWGNCTFATPTGRTEAQEKTNFATWFSYHRTRTKVAKAGASYAFNDTRIFNADNEYRVGFNTIHNRNRFDIPVTQNNGLFTGTNRQTWFDRLFAAIASGGTPLNTSLRRSGEYFMGTANTGPWGPQATAQQFECRQSFNILTTDGYRNETIPNIGGNIDGAAGPIITRPDGAPYQYTPSLPYSDAWSDSLADIAMLYWSRDLRPDLINTVPASASNPAFWQHMVTFGISIGLQGTLNPRTSLPGLTNGTLQWPQPVNLTATTLDDFFHATVNGRGSFVVASNPDEFVDGLGSALRAISARRGSGSNATVTGSSTAGGNKVFLPKYFSSEWYGELQAFNVTATGVNTTNPVWTATIPAGIRSNIFTHNGSSGTTFPTPAQTTALTADVAAYLRGDRSREQPANGGIFRQRTSLLGTIVNSSPTYVKTSSTVETLYVGANDGMMHAFNASNGQLRFSYVPRGIDLAKLKEFSEPDYGHRFFVDGPIVTSTTRELANQTVLVGTLGRGGRGLYALDVTNPTTFATNRVLWDHDASFDSDMGQVLGRPLIAKLNDGSVGLLVPNGLNSTSERAVLFVLDLRTGAKIAEINTGVGSPTASNGLSAPTGWDQDGNGTVDFVYAGDFRGNVWKFDLSSGNRSQWEVADGRPLYAPTVAAVHPITGGVTVAVDPSTDKRWVFFGTGRLLTYSDITDITRQTWYGVIDDPAANSSATRAALTARNIAQFDSATRNRAFEPYSTLPANSRGWYIDLDMPPANTLEGERMVGGQQVVRSALIASSIIPSTSNPCRPGRGYINAVDAFTGTSLQTGLFDADRSGQFGDAGDKLGGNAVGSIDLSIGMLTDPTLMSDRFIVNSMSGVPGEGELDPTLYGGRISWREIIRR
jgi:type IV pilus assembly protein PilY1